MTVYLVGAGPGDPGLLTRRGAELLAAADVVCYDRLVDRSLLALAPPGAELVDVGKTTGGGEVRQDLINDLLVRHGRAGRTVVRLKGGDPFVFGRGGEEAEALAGAGVPWEVVPGVSSAVAVPAVAGVPVTHRGLSTSVTIVTGHVGDATAPGGVDWDALGRAGGTLVVLMGMAQRAEIGRRLVAAGRPPGTPVAVVEWGTTPRQRKVRTTLGELAAVALRSPAVIVVGAVAGLDLAAAARPLGGTTVVVTRARHQAGLLSAALAAAGARVVEVPVIDVVDPDDGGEALRRAAGAVGAYRWVAFTSANAVARFLPLLRDARALAGAEVAAVGGATAAALAERGIV
ncbi:MAG: uroporphyrinogen-III C-methyltransferase, partial [Acidimicrobiales bacterium]